MYQFAVPVFREGFGVVYVGRTTDLRRRWREHLTRGQRKDGGQVKYGLVDCGVRRDTDAALKALRKNARIVYTVLPGPENCANRDVLEMALCARFAPPFNIKSER
jgi:predicted GIY-YIG superfamily endonuclease